MSKSRWSRCILALTILLIAWSIIAWAAARALVVRMPLPAADAIVVLSGAASYKERAQLAARLYHDHTASRLILTNDNLKGPWSSAEQRNPLYYERAIDELCALGVPKERIEVIPQVVLNTYEEVKALHVYSKAQGLHTLVVVTSGFHSRRALWTLQRAFKNDGIEIGLEPVPPGFQTPSCSTWWLYPNGWRLVVGEYFKIVHYRLQYA